MPRQLSAAPKERPTTRFLKLPTLRYRQPQPQLRPQHRRRHRQTLLLYLTMRYTLPLPLLLLSPHHLPLVLASCLLRSAPVPMANLSICLRRRSFVVRTKSEIAPPWLLNRLHPLLPLPTGPQQSTVLPSDPLHPTTCHPRCHTLHRHRSNPMASVARSPRKRC